MTNPAPPIEALLEQASEARANARSHVSEAMGCPLIEASFDAVDEWIFDAQQSSVDMLQEHDLETQAYTAAYLTELNIIWHECHDRESGKES